MWSRYVALGDSTSEGLEDPLPDGSGYRGWTDRLAERVATLNPELTYANLAVRGKLARQVREDQLDAALALELTGADEAWAAPLAPLEPARRHAALAGHLVWGRRHFAPWILRRLRGISSGDGRVAKRPEPRPVLEPDQEP